MNKVNVFIFLFEFDYTSKEATRTPFSIPVYKRHDDDPVKLLVTLDTVVATVPAAADAVAIPALI